MFDTSRSIRRLALVGVVGPIVWWALIAVNGALTPGYSHVGDFISTLGAVGAPYATLQVANFAIFGGAILATALALHAWFDAGRRPRLGTVLVAVMGVGVVLAGVFPQDLAAPDSITNQLHDLVSTVAFLAGVSGVVLVTRRTRADDRWPTYRYELAVTIVVLVATFVVFMASVVGEWAAVGLTQRLFIGALSVWIVLQSVRVARLAGTRESNETEPNRPSGRRPAADSSR